MRAFIQAMDVRTWRLILIGWIPSTTTDEESKKSLKVEIDWLADDDKLVNYNNKALHTIFNGCDIEYIKFISSCESAKEAWDILQTTFEDLGDVKRNKLLSLTTRFENLRMLEDESLSEFYTKLCDSANESIALSKKISKTTLVRKIARSFPDRFSSKVIAIEEAKNLNFMKIKDLMGSLHAFEMNPK